MKYGDRIAFLREQQSLTQEGLSSKLGITRASLSHYENNRREPDYDVIVSIANIFNVSIDFLIGRTDDPKRVLDGEMREFVDSLELSDHKILEKFALTVDGKKLSLEEAQRFIAFIRAQRALDE